MEKILKLFEKISPVLIRPGTSSITIGLSKRFFLFQLMSEIIHLIEEDPYLNFVALLKSYKVLGRFLHGTLHEFYRDRNKLYFKNFFFDNKLYEAVKKDILYLYPEHKELKMTITKRGIVTYDNYKKNSFNVLLITSHSGTWLPGYIKKKMNISDDFRLREEDVDTHKVYSRLVLEKGGIWIDNKLSRFACDFNRHISNAIYTNKSEHSWAVKRLWKKRLSSFEMMVLHRTYREFYFTLVKLVNAYRFNIIFDAHSMKDLPERPQISFGIKYIPKFYLPIVRSMQKKLISLNYHPIKINHPYSGGYILKWLSTMFPDVFIFSMEVNKCLYMTKDMRKTVDKKLERLSRDITQIFDIEVDDFEKAT